MTALTDTEVALFLAESEFIDWRHPLILAKAAELACGVTSKTAIARRCFEFVRDVISHSWDANMNPVICKASDVLLYGTGFCYAKSHLLAALLRANGIPAGLCYQRLSVDGDSAPFCLHGLNAIYLDEFGWYRVDARGNKPGVAADFQPPVEVLAFPITHVLEKDFPGIYSAPLSLIISVLTQNFTVEQVAANLPDGEEITEDIFLAKEKHVYPGAI